MEDLGPVAWPPEPIKTERLVLREPETRDRAAFIELLASPEVHTYLGGPRPRDELEREMSGAPERWPGHFAVELGGSMIGQILLRRAPGHHRPAAAGEYLPLHARGRPTSATCPRACRATPLTADFAPAPEAVRHRVLAEDLGRHPPK